MKNFLYSVILMLFLAEGCTNETGDWGTENTRGRMTLELSAFASFQTRALNDGDPEYYVGTVDLYFFPDNTTDTPAIYHLQQVADNYEGTTFTHLFSDEEINKLFPDGATTCTLYALTNVDNQALIDPESTLEELMSIPLSTNFPKTGNAEMTFPMDALGTLNLNADNMTMSGSLTLKRAMAKILLEITVPDQIESNGMTFTAVQEGENIIAELYNAATNGLLNGTVAEASERGFTGTGNDNTYKRTYTDLEQAEEGKHSYTHEVFYSYQNEWSSDFEDQETAIKLQMPWKNETEDEYLTYYYQIPINFSGKQLTRNHFYKIQLNVGVLGSTVPNEAITLSHFDYEILDWGDEEYNFVNELNKNHYLITEENECELWNESEATINFTACSNLAGAYLVSVAYESTKYTDDNGNSQLVYLYKSEYDSSSNSYKEVSSSTYSTDDKNAQSDFSAVVTAISNALTKETLLSYTQNEESGVVSGVGTVKFSADVDEFAGKVYRPLTFTIALVLGSSHQSLRQTVKIVQYPSKYVTFGAGGNVFVNGYYGRLNSSANNGVEVTNQSGYYRSYSFPLVNTVSGPKGSYSSSTFNTVSYTSADDVTGYYSTTSNAGIMTLSYGAGTTTKYDFTTSSSFYATNSSYEFVRGLLSSGSNSVNFVNTINVTVSAFSSKDRNFIIYDGSDGTTQYTYQYIIGDPRQDGNFVADNVHTTDEYDRTDYRLYDYYTKGGTHSETITTTTNNNNNNNNNDNNWQNNNNNNNNNNNTTTTTTITTYYDRYVKSWGSDAGKIKIGGRNENYDQVIAPYYKIQSSYGATCAGTTFDVAQKRCATYQEAGYPAGRWRLPTLAEIAFIISLQMDGVIDQMFLSDGAYWTSSGGCVQASSTKTQYWRSYANDTSKKDKGYWTRCVYDLWYWGEDGESDTTVYYPKPYK